MRFQLRHHGDHPLLLQPGPDEVTPDLPAEVRVDGGPFVMGTSTDPWAYDNERPAHEVDLPPFWLDTTPVSNRAYLEFMADGGYARPELWTAEGWAWHTEAGLVAPQFWHEAGDRRWTRVRFGRTEDLPLDQPTVPQRFQDLLQVLDRDLARLGDLPRRDEALRRPVGQDQKGPEAVLALGGDVHGRRIPTVMRGIIPCPEGGVNLFRPSWLRPPTPTGSGPGAGSP